MLLEEYLKVARDILAANGIMPFQALEDEPLQYDSLTFISIVVDIENSLGIAVDDSLLAECPNTYNEWVSFIARAEAQYREKQGEQADTDINQEQGRTNKRANDQASKGSSFWGGNFWENDSQEDNTGNQEKQGEQADADINQKQGRTNKRANDQASKGSGFWGGDFWGGNFWEGDFWESDSQEDNTEKEGCEDFEETT